VLALEREVISFQPEHWSHFSQDASALFPLHWAELAVNQDHIKLDCDYERYQKLDDMGMLYVLTARSESRLIGYVVCFLITHMHYKSSGMFALADMYFLLPEYRKGGCGAKMLMAMEQDLKKMGVTQAHMSCKVHQDHSKLFDRMGWKLTDYTFIKYLKGNQ
jgi:GNAT superfamily N-acetyltransferase